jgi:hypothetical protein
MAFKTITEAVVQAFKSRVAPRALPDVFSNLDEIRDLVDFLDTEARHTANSVFHYEQDTDPTIDHDVVAGEWWADSANTTLKKRNAANDAWVTWLGPGGGGSGGEVPEGAVTDSLGVVVTDSLGATVTIP